MSWEQQFGTNNILHSCKSVMVSFLKARTFAPDGQQDATSIAKRCLLPLSTASSFPFPVLVAKFCLRMRVVASVNVKCGYRECFIFKSRIMQTVKRKIWYGHQIRIRHQDLCRKSKLRYGATNICSIYFTRINMQILSGINVLPRLKRIKKIAAKNNDTPHKDKRCFPRSHVLKRLDL